MSDLLDEVEAVWKVLVYSRPHRAFSGFIEDKCGNNMCAASGTRAVTVSGQASGGTLR